MTTFLLYLHTVAERQRERKGKSETLRKKERREEGRGGKKEGKEGERDRERV